MRYANPTFVSGGVGGLPHVSDVLLSVFLGMLLVGWVFLNSFLETVPSPSYDAWQACQV